MIWFNDRSQVQRRSNFNILNNFSDISFTYLGHSDSENQISFYILIKFLFFFSNF